MQILEIEIDKLKTELAICGKDGRSINKCQRTYKLMTQIKDSLKFSKPLVWLSVRGVISQDKISYNIVRIAEYMMTITLMKTCYMFETTMKSMYVLEEAYNCSRHTAIVEISVQLLSLSIVSC